MEEEEGDRVSSRGLCHLQEDYCRSKRICFSQLINEKEDQIDDLFSTVVVALLIECSVVPLLVCVGVTLDAALDASALSTIVDVWLVNVMD